MRQLRKKRVARTHQHQLVDHRSVGGPPAEQLVEPAWRQPVAKVRVKHQTRCLVGLEREVVVNDAPVPERPAGSAGDGAFTLHQKGDGAARFKRRDQIQLVNGCQLGVEAVGKGQCAELAMTKDNAIEQKPQRLATHGVAEGRSRHAHPQTPTAFTPR